MHRQEELIKGAKKTYFSYLKLDFAREYQFQFEGEDNPCSLSQYIKKLLERSSDIPVLKHCKIGDKEFSLNFDTQDNRIVVTLERPVALPSAATDPIEPKQNIDEYNDDEALRLLLNTPFIIPLTRGYAPTSPTRGEVIDETASQIVLTCASVKYGCIGKLITRFDALIT